MTDSRTQAAASLCVCVCVCAPIIGNGVSDLHPSLQFTLTVTLWSSFLLLIRGGHYNHTLTHTPIQIQQPLCFNPVTTRSLDSELLSHFKRPDGVLNKQQWWRWWRWRHEKINRWFVCKNSLGKYAYSLISWFKLVWCVESKCEAKAGGGLA